MYIALKKFGTTLLSREAGKEAYAAYAPTLKGVTKDEIVEVDFVGVITFSPSWGDEFLSPLQRDYKERLLLNNSENSSVQATLKLLEQINKMPFNIKRPLSKAP
ncbi:MAG: hypothetical protein HY983_03995 [Candidatus Magasanikbacteria bacterium]|nr:hypothetical protein [Candidatus Magasanikbacteria bacterium]